MKPDELKAGWWAMYCALANKPDVPVMITGLFGKTATVKRLNGFHQEVPRGYLRPATLDDLAVTLGGVKCWFARTETDGGGEISLTDSSRNGVYWSAIDNQLGIALALAAAVNAPPITEEQWKELTND